MRYSLPSITTYNHVPVSAYLSWTKEGIPPTCNPGGPHQSHKTNSDTPKSTVFSVAKCMASLRHSRPSITTYNPVPVLAYLS